MAHGKGTGRIGGPQPLPHNRIDIKQLVTEHLLDIRNDEDALYSYGYWTSVFNMKAPGIGKGSKELPRPFVKGMISGKRRRALIDSDIAAGNTEFKPYQPRTQLEAEYDEKLRIHMLTQAYQSFRSLPKPDSGPTRLIPDSSADGEIDENSLIQELDHALQKLEAAATAWDQSLIEELSNQ